MSALYERSFVRDDGVTEVQVLFTIAWGSPPSGLYGPPEDYDPGDGDMVEIDDVFAADASKVTLTDDEAQRFETEVLESEDYVNDDDGGDYYDYDD